MSGGVLGEVAPSLSYAIARLEVVIAWTDFELALADHDYDAATEAIFEWYERLQALKAAQ